MGVFAIALLVQLAADCDGIGPSYALNDELFDRTLLPPTAQIEIYRREFDKTEWFHAYVPATWQCAPHRDLGRFCYKIRAVDSDAVPLSDFSEEACEPIVPSAPSGLIVK